MKSALVAVNAFLLVPFAIASAGTQKSIVSVSANPSSATTGNPIDFTAVVQPESASTSQPISAPTGTLTFYDGATPLNSTALTLITSGSIGSATFQQVFGTLDASLSIANSPGELTGDFTGSGQTSLIVYGSAQSASGLIIQTFVPKAGGGYTAMAAQTLNFAAISAQTFVSANAGPVAIDANGDGKLDILDGISVAYGNGDGTFQAPVTLPFLSIGFIGTWVADVNGDGKQDILAVNNPGLVPGSSSQPVAFQITVFENQGSGTFASLGTFTIADSGTTPSTFVIAAMLNGLAFADLNGDGKVDIVAESSFTAMGNAPGPPQISTVLNNGDGTFAAHQDYTSPIAISAMALGDFNGDGNADLALAYNDGTGRANLYVAPGNGDGTFATGQTLDLNPTPGVANTRIGTLVAGDFNWDGKLDVATGNGLWAEGNGDGTFRIPAAPLFPPVVGNYEILAFPVVPFIFPGNAAPGLVYLNLAPNSTAVITTTGQSTASLQTSSLSAGVHSITAAYSGNANYGAATSEPVTVDVAAAAPTLTISGSTALTVNSGGSISTTVSIGGGGGFNRTATLACSGLPTYATCSFAPPSVSVAGNTTASTTMTVNTGRASGQHASLALPLGIGGGGSLVLALMMFVPLPRRRSYTRWMVPGGLAALAAIGIAGCGGASAANLTPAGTYSFTVTATSGSVQTNVAYTLTVH